MKLWLSGWAIGFALTGFAQNNPHTMNSEKADKLQEVLNKTVDGKKVFGTQFALKQDSITWYGNAGNLPAAQPYFIASTTKLFTTALVLQLVAEGKVQLDDPISKYLDKQVMQGLHVYKGTDYSKTITIRHLLAHTSGLPDYFQGKNNGSPSLEDALVSGADKSWTFEESISLSKTLSPHFAPGTPKKALYADTNFQLLGKIIENVSGQSYDEICNTKIIQALGLTQTYIYRNKAGETPQTLYYKNKPLHIPLAMASFGPDGGVVSTSADMLVFIEAFFTGILFPRAYLEDMQTWNRIFFPMQSGVGIHLFRLPRLFNLTGAIPDYLGHSGLSGALAFYCPTQNLFIAGTVNQVAHPDISFKTMIRLTRQLQKINKQG